MTNVVPAKLAYKCYEPKSGKKGNYLNPVIFLHGGMQTKEDFKDLPQIIADGTNRKAYALDARNHGDSEYTDFFNFDVNVDDLIHFMDTMNIQKAVFIGHSMGGITAIKAALRKHERTEMIFVEDMYTKKAPKELLEAIAGFIEMWAESIRSAPKELNYNEALKFACDAFYGKMPPNTPNLPPKEVFCRQNFVLKHTADGGYEIKVNKDVLCKAFKDAENIMSEPSGQYNGPAYFLCGTLSEFRVWEEEENIKKHFPKAELIKFEGATHGIHMDFPELFTSTILQRLSQ